MNSSNRSSTDAHCILGAISKHTKTGLTCAYLLVFIAAIIGNSVVIYSVKSRTRLRISFNYFILNMACADLLHAFLAIPVSIAYLYVGTNWFSGPFALFLCKFIHYGLHTAIVVSITTLTATTIERFLAAKLILKKPITSKMAQGLIAAIWIYALVITVHEAIKFNVVTYSNTSQPHCMPDIKGDWVKIYKIEITLKFLMAYAFPLVTMATLYANIIWMLRQHSGSSLQTEQYQSIQRRKRNLIKRLVITTLVFAVCWLPVHINHFIGTFHYRVYTCMPQYWILIFYWLAHANTAINPVLYLLLTKNARALFKSSVHVAKPDGNENGSRRSGSRRLWMFQRFPSDSRLLTACVSAMQSSESQGEEKGHEMNDLIENQQ
ncbi:hypothetical protein QZH41_003189 [Actinostola sp. cb2023]|nr:hypothetical protein QZH41_003189 [Actinostola sp. cb2023]